MTEIPREQGQKIEDRLRKFFKGVKISCDEVDFETSTSLYEVKSTKLFRTTINQNSKRTYMKICHNNISSAQLGRFHINPGNHILLYLRALQTNKTPKYIFVIRIENQIIWKILPWEKVIVPNQENRISIKLKSIFYNNVAPQEQRAEI